MKVNEFAYGSEKLVNPIEVGRIHYLQKWLHILPQSWQRKIITSASKKTPKMGFIVEPYAFFLFYEIKDPTKVIHLLPDGFEPTKSCAFVGDEAKYYGIVSTFRIHASTFWGARSEFYVIARNKQTGLMSWVILDYVSDTISYDKKHGLRSAEASRAVVTTTCEGKVLVDIANSDARRVAYEADISQSKLRNLDEKLWIEGNTSIAYGKEIAQGGELFSLTFMPEEMATAWEIPLTNVSIEEISWFPEVLGGELAQAACFPYAQHMLSDSPGTSTYYGSKAALRQAVEKIDFDHLV